MFGVPLASGVVQAEKQPDGTVVVRGLPFFSEIRETDPAVKAGVREARGPEWLQRAFEKHHARLTLNQKPLLTLRHQFDQPEAVGTYRLTHMGRAAVNPGEEPRVTLFGDKVYESEDAFNKAKDYQFRSVEMSIETPDELSALALLKDKMPSFRYPNVRERLAPQLVEAFESWASRFSAPQVWRGGVETFMGVSTAPLNYEGAREPYAVARSMANKGEIAAKRVGEVGDAAKRENHEATKEGDMPADTKDKKEPSTDEKLEALVSKCFDMMMSKFEDRLKGSATGKDAKADTEKAGGTEEPKESAEATPELEKQEKKQDKADKSGETHQAASRGPDPVPAVMQAVPPAPIGAETFAALAVKDQTILGLKAEVDRMKRRDAAGAIVAKAKKALVDMGVPVVSEMFEAAVFKAAVDGGEPEVGKLLESVKVGLSLTQRGPETFGAFGTFSPQVLSPHEAAKKRALETFGAIPGANQRINELYGQFMAQGDHFLRSADPESFFEVCEGTPSVNPECGTIDYYRRKARLAAAAKNGKAS